jgi:hypothetical protein
MPEWVSKHFRYGIHGELIHRRGTIVKEGHWIVARLDENFFTLDDAEFHSVFRELPQQSEKSLS